MAAPEQDWLSLGWVISYPLLAVLAVMIFVSAEEITRPVVRPVANPTAPEAADWSASFADRVEALHRLVLAAPLGVTVSGENSQGAGAVRWTHRTLDLTVDRERKAALEAAIEALRDADPGVTLVSESTFNGSQVLIGLDGLLTHTLRVYWSDQPVRPRIGLVIAALGDDLRLARQFIELEPPHSVAVLPFRPFSAQVAELAKILKREVLLDWNEVAAERGLDEALGTVPGAVGVAIRGDAGEELLAALRQRGLILVDADGGAQGPRVVLLPIGGDSERAVETVTGHAQAGGSAVGVAVAGGADELRSLRDLLARWNKEEIDVVEVSRLYPAPPAT